MRNYCKAYHLKDLRQFDHWLEKDGSSELTDSDVVYLWDDFTVVKSPVIPGGVIFDSVSPAWKEFCQTTLAFKLPEDLQYLSSTSQPKSHPQSRRNLTEPVLS